ncbi:MAG TPA: PIN domain-containing protein [Candidatus Latescibacteria bacterium]|nr:PIN domain-containing protein [Candidatus Latescibacterota bacterium]
MIGVDTGFFFALREGDPTAVKVFEEEDLAASVLTRFELRRLSFRKSIPWPDFAVHLTRSVAILELTAEAADQAAGISHGTGMPAIDALILASLVAAGCRTIYTRDEHFLRLARQDVEIIRL